VKAFQTRRGAVSSRLEQSVRRTFLVESGCIDLFIQMKISRMVKESIHLRCSLFQALRLGSSLEQMVIGRTV
jgi:hypothetical protein